ncbi:MAG: C39 family peptidase [Pirellulales bacterium]|nr:C39 family peptidase [Pirellulales bacterium]
MKTRAKRAFSPLCELQLPSHCGPCSLSACLFVLGISATQTQLAAAAGKSVSVFTHGVDERGLRRAAKTFGVRSDFVLYNDRAKGNEFARRLRSHLRQGSPGILLSKHFEHWVAVIGYLARQRKFIIVDPKAKTVFFRWSEATLIRNAWNVAEGEDSYEPDQYFAILLSRSDGEPPKWKISESWLRLCERGSSDTAEGMANDLAEMAVLASPNERQIEEGPFLAEFLEANEDLIIGSITHWAGGNGNVTRGDLRTFYRDYTTVASSSGIRISLDTDTTFLVAQLTALLCSYWWGARF